MIGQIRINCFPYSDFELICHYLEALKKRNKVRRQKVKKSMIDYLLQFSKVFIEAPSTERETFLQDFGFHLDNIRIEAEIILNRANGRKSNSSHEILKAAPLIIQWEFPESESLLSTIHEGIIKRICYTMTGLEAVSYLLENGYYSCEQHRKHVENIIHSANFLVEFMKQKASSNLNLAGVTLPELKISSNNSETSQSNGTEQPGFEGADPSIVKAYKGFLN